VPFTDPGFLRERMVSQVIAGRRPIAAAVTEALRAVPRHVFLPGLPPEEAYRDEAIVTKRDADGQPISSSSQPTIMAIMLDQLGLAPGQRVLEIGAGTGYNAALIKRIVGPDGTVVSVDLDEDLTGQARAHLAAAGYQDVTVVCGDGAEGYPARAPYDRIIATVRVSDLAPAWLSQLTPGGRIVVPLELHGAQRSVAFERAAAPERAGMFERAGAFERAGVHWQSRSVVPCGFMRMRGTLAGPDMTRVTGGELAVTLPDDRSVDIAAVARALAGPPAECITQVIAGREHLFDGLGLWLAVHEPMWGLLTASGPPGLARALVSVKDQQMTAGLFADDSFAVLARPEKSAPPFGPDGPRPASGATPAGFPLSTLGYGPAGPELAARLAAQIRAWDAAGRPLSADMHISAYPVAGPPPVAPLGAVISRPHTTFVIYPGPDDQSGPRPFRR
jgi:protein-L-isoaspartate(D-aspartate) O-methyltransferase